MPKINIPKLLSYMNLLLLPFSVFAMDTNCPTAAEFNELLKQPRQIRGVVQVRFIGPMELVVPVSGPYRFGYAQLVRGERLVCSYIGEGVGGSATLSELGTNCEQSNKFLWDFEGLCPNNNSIQVDATACKVICRGF